MPACSSSSSGVNPSAAAIACTTRIDGSWSPRSTWLKYGFETCDISAIWRSDRLASLRCARMNAPRACSCSSRSSTERHGTTLIPRDAQAPTTSDVATLVELVASRDVERLGIELLSVFGLPPVEFVNLAADLGCRYISSGLSAGPYNPHGYPSFSLRDDA